MKFNCSVEINAPIDKVIDLFDNPDNLKEWQDGFQSFEHISGVPGEPGAKSKLAYQMGKGSLEMTETIKTRNLPYEFTGLYEFKQGANTMKNTFAKLSENTTRWDAELEYISIHSFMMKVMAKIRPQLFQKQTQKWMDQFRDFVERS